MKSGSNRMVRCYVLGLFILSGRAVAADPPFTEDFAQGSANWADAAGAFNLDYVATGGPDGNGYVSDGIHFQSAMDGDSVAFFRAHAALGSSGGAFVGNWITDSVGRFSAQVRHDLPVPVNFFTRFASPFNFPGAIGIEFTPVLPHTWTEISFEIDAANPQFVSFEGSDFATVFSNVGNVQVGVNVPVGFGMTSTPYRVDLDVASISAVPEPGIGIWIVFGAISFFRCAFSRQL